MSAPLTVGELAELVRSKNAGPFWQTVDIFFADDESYRAVADTASLTPDAVARLYRVEAANVHIWYLADLRVVKISFPRPTIQGSRGDRDMHAGQQHIPLAALALEPPDQ